MIKRIYIKHCEEKSNWIDQNNVVFGYDECRQCCEMWGYGVYNPITKEKISNDPDGMPYHFDFSKGAKENTEEYFSDIECPDVVDCVHIDMISDDESNKRLVFECWCNHNGYYYHSFDLERKEDK
jgi:hypothetical protein